VTTKLNYICEICDKEFANKYSLKKHEKSVHDVKQYPCEVCGKQFHKHHLLKTHMLEHSGDLTPHKCSQCEMCFQSPSHLKRHQRNHRSFECRKCEISFEHHADLAQHQAAEHTEPRSVRLVGCDQCDKQFKCSSILARHKAVHAETRDTLQCPREHCPRYFYYKNNLAHHIKSYHEGKKYFCSLSGCTNKFSTKQKLKDHLSTVHNSDFVAVKKPRKKPTKRRKDVGTFKKPMAAILTGVECREASSLLREEQQLRPLDSIEKISAEVEEFLDTTSEASEAESWVGCRRGVGLGTAASLEPPLILGNIRRLENDKHFRRMRVSESSSDSETAPPAKKPALSKPTKVFDFSKFIIHN